MLNFGKSLSLFRLDRRRYTKTLDRIMGQIIREAAREWLRAILVSVPSRGGFPVLTGAAKSTLAPLGRVLRVMGTNSVTPAANVKDGRARGEAAQTFSIDDRGFTYTFEWTSDLLHFYLNNFYRMPTVPSSPWHSIEQGERAFIAYVEDALLQRVPKLAEYIDIEDI